MMLGLQGNTSSSKVYRCVACSATFTGLASLLVHQASHASTLSKVTVAPQQPVISPHEALLPNVDLSREQAGPTPRLLESPSPSFYICDCGEEFLDFSLMLEHKRSHIAQIQPPENNIGNQDIPNQRVSLSSTLTQPSLGLGLPSTSKSPAFKLDTLQNHKTDVSLGDGIATITPSQGQCAPPQDDSEEQLDNMSATEEIPETEDVHFQENRNYVLDVENGGSLPKNNALMKLLASAYMNRFPPRQNNDDDDDDDTVIPKQEAVPVDITPGAKTEVPSINDRSTAQLRLAKSGMKSKSPPISRILESSKKRVVSLTKTFSPVVVLETRQKLMDPVGNGTYGMYQCGRCRRIFQNLDRLTEHHLLHKKERIKCCRRCKQLIIGRPPLPDNHVCPHLGNKTIQSSSSFKSKFPFGQKIVPFHRLNSTKKVFFCPLCKHSYARRWNLKMHKCQASAVSQQEAGSQVGRSVGVGTEVTGQIKVELASLKSNRTAVPQLAWTHPAKRFSPFSPKPSVMEQHKDTTLCSLQQTEENSWDAAAVDINDGNKGQWTVPLDEEMEMLNTAVKADDDRQVRTSVSVKQAETTPASLRFFVREGVKRYPCNRCQKTYSRASTLRRHLRLCGFRPRGLGAVAQDDCQASIRPTANSVKPMFACCVCGKNFNRKDNMMVHTRKCKLQGTVPVVDKGTVQQQSLPGGAADQTQDANGGNWGFMSLPSVLPRRVTCECGVGFTSPRLLLEHLQKHAQESYTCPTCGETVNSWADYEVHLQIHMHPHHQLLKGMQPQRSQPLLLRFQQQPPPQQPPPQKQPRPEQLPNASKKQRIGCTRCGNTFATRCSLRRHVSWNRCKVARMTNLPTNMPKAHHCSHCNCDFPNTISLIFHQRTGACKPAIKPVRCPVCLRWFSTVDGLQKHLLTHKQSDSYSCNICQGTYPNLKSLKNHRRRIHRIMAGDTALRTQEALTS